MKNTESKGDWWFSADGMRGFNWPAVIGFDFKKAGDKGAAGYHESCLYAYTLSGILHFKGSEAEKLFEEMKTRSKQL